MKWKMGVQRIERWYGTLILNLLYEVMALCHIAKKNYAYYA